MQKLTLENMFGNARIDITCPGCKHKFNVYFKDLAKEGNKITCPSCKNAIVIQHSPETRQTIKDADKSFRELERTLKKFGK